MTRLLPLIALGLAFPAAAQEAPTPATPGSVVEAAQPQEWRAIPAEDLLIMELAPAANGAARKVVIQLMPPPFSQPWVENIRTLARAGWWDGLSVYRSVDNWVVQWGDVTEEKPLPEGVVSPTASYTVSVSALPRGSGPTLAEIFDACPDKRRSRCSAEHLPPEARRQIEVILRRAPIADHYSEGALLREGWPLAMTRADATAWPIHCYGSVGVARDLAPDTGTGAELYTVIGHAPRQLDRNIAVVGRVIEGMEHLSTLPRGTGSAGVYESREEDTPILSVRLASDLSASPAFEYLSTDSESFASYLKVRANRQDDFYTVPARGVDICNVPVPVRRVKE